MIPDGVMLPFMDAYFPRIRGDDPNIPAENIITISFSPYSRG